MLAATAQVRCAESIGAAPPPHGRIEYSAIRPELCAKPQMITNGLEQHPYSYLIYSLTSTQERIHEQRSFCAREETEVGELAFQVTQSACFDRLTEAAGLRLEDLLKRRASLAADWPFPGDSRGKERRP